MCTQEVRRYALAAPLPVRLLILSLPMAGQREELYSLKGATLPYRYAHPDTVVVDQQLLHIETSSVEYRVPTTLRNFTVTNIKVSSISSLI